VEAVFEGEEEDVKALVEYCHRGPSTAMITNVDVEWEPYHGEFRDFRTW
jgi:acylphosphatase